MAFAVRLAKLLSEAIGNDGGNGADDGDSGSTTGKNFVFSPVSIYSALATVAAGANGDTLNELLAVLGAASREEVAEFVHGVVESALADQSCTAGPLVAFTCSLWHEKMVTLKPAYRTGAEESYEPGGAD
ncbi:hypothetical protein QOZ80_3AG0218000 [Eleusine coracana subsp. coracana]|nr:hypothetical protein QOZ80_3AG0218000 [Eleusine coracana subsp. coracana]